MSSHFFVMSACSSRWMALISSFCSSGPAGMARYRYLRAMRIVRADTSVIVPLVVVIFVFVLVYVVFGDEWVVVRPFGFHVGFDQGQ